MKITIEGTTKEIAALVLELQERRTEKFTHCDASGGTYGPNQGCTTKQNMGDAKTTDPSQKSRC